MAWDWEMGLGKVSRELPAALDEEPSSQRTAHAQHRGLRQLSFPWDVEV